MTERGCNEEFNTRTGMNGFPSSLSEPMNDTYRQRREKKDGFVLKADPAAPNAACDD
ncbi:hypothetical protein KDAU_21600 [Dictyobacter aurantiacus]|uniref:Uncharacterized protein n=1 Tax=Dictyobacter aurantiacus TaxID=1936993 RepID=A0A401ZD63_9CHLR|nr:hypothetical protein KDAU_21600 [Dictyobacter aurantiacus]